MGGGASPGEVLWTWQTSDIVLGICAVGATLIYLDFMLIPLTMAYFTTFMMLPVLEAFEKRPYGQLCIEKAPWTKMMPVVDEEATAANGEGGETVYMIDVNRNQVLARQVNPGLDDFFKMEEDENGNVKLDADGKPIRDVDNDGNDIKADGAWIKELVMLQKIPHMIACLLTLVVSFGTLGALIAVVLSNFSAFASNEEAKAAEGQPTISDDMCRMGNDFIADLERDGVNILRPRTCSRRNISTTKVWSDLQDVRTVASPLFDGADMVNDADNCKSMPVNGRFLDVRRYSNNTFKCEQDWEKIVTIAKPWCGMDMLTVASTDGTVNGLVDTMDAADLRLFYSCVDLMIGANEARDTTSDPWMAALPQDRQTVEAQLLMGGLTGDVDPYAAKSGCNSTMPFPECVSKMRAPFIRYLAGLAQTKVLLPTADTVATGCSDFNDDNDFKGICAASLDGADLMSIATDVLAETCEGAADEAACSDGYCTYVQAGTVGGVVQQEGCVLNAQISETNFKDVTVSDLCPATFAPTAGQEDASCTRQLTWARAYYLGELEEMRMAKPPVSYTLGVKIDNFASEISEVPENCSSIDLFCSPDLEDEFGQLITGQPWAELMTTVGAVGTLLSDVVLVLLLAVYILMERPMEEPDSRTVLEVEAMIKNYINLKVLLSAMTGAFVAGFLQVCGVQLAMVFGLLAFMLNFVPCVGSAIATVLPIPLIILDDGLSETEKLVAFLGPSSVQMYVGNALEPSLFGKSLNLTEISVLNALVLAQLCWGLCGAVLSVPMLGMLKIVCHHTEHPIAKYVLAMVRADAAYP